MSEPMTKSEVLAFCQTNHYSPAETEHLLCLCEEIWKKHRREKNNIAMCFACCDERERRRAEKLELDKKWWLLFLFFLIFVLKKNEEEAREALLKQKLAEERNTRGALDKMRAAIQSRKKMEQEDFLEQEQMSEIAEEEESPAFPAFKI